MKKKFRPQFRAYVRWEEEDDRPRVRPMTAEELREQAHLDMLTAEGITVREKLEREGKLPKSTKTKKPWLKKHESPRVNDPLIRPAWKAGTGTASTKSAPHASTSIKTASPTSTTTIKPANATTTTTIKPANARTATTIEPASPTSTTTIKPASPADPMAASTAPTARATKATP